MQIVVQHIGVAAIGIQRHHTVLTLTGTIERRAVLRCRALPQLVIPQHITAQLCTIFKDSADICLSLRAQHRRGCIGLRHTTIARQFRHWRCDAWVSQIQWRNYLNDTCQTHKGTTAFAAARQACSRGVDVVKGILTGIDSGDDLVDL